MLITKGRVDVGGTPVREENSPSRVGGGGGVWLGGLGGREHQTLIRNKVRKENSLMLIVSQLENALNPKVLEKIPYRAGEVLEKWGRKRICVEKSCISYGGGRNTRCRLRPKRNSASSKSKRNVQVKIID